MADLKTVVKKMREDGLSADEAKASLRELGFTNADAIVAEIYGTTAGAAGGKELFSEENPPEAEESEGGAEGKGENKALFGGKPAKEEPEAAEAESETPEKLEIPELKITRVEGGEEREVSIEEMLKTAESGAGEPALTKAEAAGLKAKLDETISLLKALQEINKKILDAEREVLMRLK